MVKAWLKVMCWSAQLCISGLLLHRAQRMETPPEGGQTPKCLTNHPEKHQSGVFRRSISIYENLFFSKKAPLQCPLDHALVLVVEVFTFQEI